MSENKREIEDLRQEMARLDAQILVCLDKRAKTARRVGELRKDQPSTLPLADRAALAAMVARATGDMPPDALREIFREIYAACMSLEMPVPVAYVGPEGGVGHAAARSRFGVAAKFLGTDGASAAFEEVTRQRAHYAVVPFETREDGPVQATVSALMVGDLKIVAMFEGSSNLQLMNRTGNPGDIETVYATAADHAICSRYLQTTAPKARIMDATTPLLACQLAQDDHGGAAVAMESFGAQFGLEVARRNVRDDGDQRIRYAVVGPRPSTRTGNDLTALLFSVHDTPGALHEVLKQFAERGINLTKIQSRPAGEAWTYVFFVEVVGHPTDRNVVAALEEIRRSTKFFKVLGSYGAVL
jgi:chorismate mutase/prephenate dehydratase